VRAAALWSESHSHSVQVVDEGCESSADLVRKEEHEQGGGSIWGRDGSGAHAQFFI
jgi:hypothetical protein